MAKCFGYTPSQTDEIELDRVNYMLGLECEWRKKEAEDSKQ